MGSQSPLLNRSNTTTAPGRCSVPSKRSTDETMVIAPSPISLILFSLLLLPTTSTVTLATTPARFNISHYIYPKTSDEFRPQPSFFLTEVLQTIAKGEKWREDDVRVSKLEVGKVKYGVLQGYDIRVRFGGKIDLVFKSWDEVSEWKKFKEGDDFESLANQVSSNPVLESLKLDGPFVLSVASRDDDLSLMLPLNSSHTSLKRILVGEGITVEVKGGQEISLLYASALDLRANSSPKIKNQQSESWSFTRSLCMAITPIKIFGSASVIAFRARNPNAHIEAVLMSKETIELLPEKCYSRHTYKSWKCPLPSLRLRVSLLEKLLRRIFYDRVNQNPISGYFKIKLQASSVFRFQLELERDVRSNDTQWSTMAEWRTRPTVERAWFQVLARTEMKRLKPLMIKKVKPFIGVDSWAWSKLMSNISFTKFPSDLVAPEPLTLDVRW